MKRKPLAFIAAFSLALLLGVGPTQGEETVDPIASAVSAYQAQFQAARDAGEWPSGEQRGVMVDGVLVDIDVSGLTLDQLGELMSAMPIVYSQASETADAALAEFAKSVDADGARAAGLRLRLVSQGTEPAAQAQLIRAVFNHPGLAGAWAQGHAMEAFNSLYRLDAEQLASLHTDFVGLESLVDPAYSAVFFARVAGAFFSFASIADDDSLAAREPLRARNVEVIDTKLSGAELPENDTKTLTDARARLNGAFAKGLLIGHPAPELNFTWWSTPGNESETYGKLSDLKGKVVVVDFWATWCGPCIGSFPNVKELQEYYEGYDVVIVGVTSLQGAHYPGDGREKISTADEPAKEMAFMHEFMTEKEVSWSIAFAEEPVFNPDYGVNGIPHVAIIDPQGVVRFRGLHPAMPMEAKTSKINKLLVEAGKPAPTEPMVEEEAAVSADTQ